MDWHGAFTPKSIKKHVALPLVTVLIGAAFMVLAVFACKNYEETITAPGWS